MIPTSPKALTIALLAVLPFTATQAQNQTSSPPAWEIDWVPLEQLGEDQREALDDPLCCGAYLEPEIEPLPGTAQPDSLMIEANEGSMDDAGTATVEGNVRARQLNTTVSGDHGVFDRGAQQFSLQGNVRARQPGLLLAGESGVVDNDQGTMRLDDASYVLHEQRLRGSADIIVYTDEDGIVTIDNGRFSRCEPGSNDWVMQAASIRLDREAGRGSARHATLRIRDIPVLYTPYVSFPITDERSSGFLPASIGSTTSGGLDLTLPYYFNLAPNYDATYTPRFMSDRGLHHGLELRHLGQRSENQLNMGFLPSDGRYDADARKALEEALENDTPLPEDTDIPPTEERWLINAEHQGRLGDRWSTLLDYQAVSDEDYFRDFATDGVQVSSRSYLRRRGELRYNGDIWQLDASLENYQIIDPDLNRATLDYSLWPQISLSGDFATDFSLDYGIESHYTYFDRRQDADEFSQSQIDRGLMVDGGRFTSIPYVRYNWVTPGIFIIPELRYYHRSYDLENQALETDDSPTVGIFSGSLDAGLIFERTIRLFGESVLQTLEPRIFYLNNEHENQDDLPVFDSTSNTFSFSQLFRRNTFSGLDRISDSEQVTVALSTRFFSEEGREVASASIGQIRYLRDRQVTLNGRITEEETQDSSNVAAELDYRLSDEWRINSYLEWNPHDNSFDAGSFQFQYQSDINRILNLGLQFRDRDIRQTRSADSFDRSILQSDIQVAWPLTQSWGVVGRYNYDHANDRPLEQLAGVEYSSCCWNLRFVYREWVDRLDQRHRLNARKDYGLFLQFELKGLGSVLGGNIGGILENSIRGYRQ